MASSGKYATPLTRMRHAAGAPHSGTLEHSTNRTTEHTGKSTGEQTLKRARNKEVAVVRTNCLQLESHCETELSLEFQLLPHCLYTDEEP